MWAGNGSTARHGCLAAQRQHCALLRHAGRFEHSYRTAHDTWLQCADTRQHEDAGNSCADNAIPEEHTDDTEYHPSDELRAGYTQSISTHDAEYHPSDGFHPGYTQLFGSSHDAKYLPSDEFRPNDTSGEFRPNDTDTCAPISGS